MNGYARTVAAVIITVTLALSISASASESDIILAELQRNDWQVRLMNNRALEAMSKPESMDALLSLIRNQGVDWRIQIRGIRLLGQMHTDRAKDALVDLFNDLFFHQECPAVRSSLAQALGNFDGPRVVAALVRGLDDTELLIREASIVALGKAGDASAVPHLIAQLKDVNFAIKSSAIHALGLLKDERAVPSLTNIADHDDEPLLRREALTALSMIRGTELGTLPNDEATLVGKSNAR